MRRVDRTTAVELRAARASVRQGRMTSRSAPVAGLDALVRCVTRRAHQAHAARAVCAALAAGVLTLACAVESGARLGSWESLALAGAMAVASFVAWTRSSHATTREVLRSVDERLHLGSQFVAAWEGRRAAPDSPISQLGAARLLERVPRSSAQEAAMPHTLGFALLPVLAIFTFVRAIDARDDRVIQRGAEVGAFTGVASDVRSVLQRHGDDLPADVRAELTAAAERLERAAAGAPSDGADAARQECADAAEHLQELAESAEPGSPLANALADAAADAELAAFDENAEAEVAYTTEVPTDGAATGGGESTSGATDDEPGEVTSDPASIASETEATSDPRAGANGSTGGTTSGASGDPDAAGEHAPTAPPAVVGEPNGPARLGATRWWSRRDAPIVEAWIERNRERD